ncbi:MAG: A/G-specific adenine glycosylase [Armatimonadota bacterium]
MAGGGQLNAEAIAGPLLNWFDAHRRDLPWRRTSDPYRIWISEVMLQQTQVDRVIAYYERFIATFPTVEALAEAQIEDVLRLWEGLGYYSRARNLHAAARIVVEQHAGDLPRSPKEIRLLPGIGEYTAGAVLSIAFGLPVHAVDANVVRVLARLSAIEGDVSKGEGRRRIADIAAEAVPDDRPGDFNQALMELGALICVPGRPGCLICPLTEICEARRLGRQADIPPPKSHAVKEQISAAGVVRDEAALVLIARRPPEGQWGGLWEFPNTRLDGAESPRDALRACLARSFGMDVAVRDEVASFTYGVMNRRVALTVFACEHTGGTPAVSEHDEVRWAAVTSLAQIAMPSPHRAIAEMLREGDS